MRRLGKGTVRVIAAVVVLALAVGLGACGSKKKKAAAQTDPVAMALQAPGVRTVVIPKQRRQLTIAVPPCSAANVDQESTKIPPGSNEVVIPEDSPAERVAIQPCTATAQQASQTAGTVLVTPGGATAGAKQAGGQSQQQNQLVLPNDSNLKTVIVPPCTKPSGGAGQSGQSSGTALPAVGDEETVTAPPCTASQQSSSAPSG
jgi:hypothetical protein